MCLGLRSRHTVTTCILPRILKRSPVTNPSQTGHNGSHPMERWGGGEMERWSVGVSGFRWVCIFMNLVVFLH